MDLAALGLAPAFGLTFVLVFALLLPVLLLRGGRKDARPTRSLRTLVVLGSGGHTTEMLSMLASMPEEVVKGSVFIIAATDTMSQTTLETQFPGAVVLRTPRAREVRQLWLTRCVNNGVHVRAHVCMCVQGVSMPEAVSVCLCLCLFFVGDQVLFVRACCGRS